MRFFFFLREENLVQVTCYVNNRTDIQQLQKPLNNYHPVNWICRGQLAKNFCKMFVDFKYLNIEADRAIVQATLARIKYQCIVQINFSQGSKCKAHERF